MSTTLSNVPLPDEATIEKSRSPEPIAAPLTSAQIAIVKATAPVLREHGETITTLFYKNLLNDYPQLKNMFNRTSQTTGAQPRALAAAVFAYATYVDDLGKLKAIVERIAHKHASLDVQPEQYAIVGKYLLEAVATVLGDAVTPEVGEAWTAAYAALADVFINREGQIYAEHDQWKGWRKFRIQKKQAESSEITSFYLVPEDGKTLPPFKPGQYLSVRVFVPALGHMQPRQYSLSDEPSGEHYRITVKRDAGQQPGVPGLISNALHADYKEGDTLEVTHPTGDFFVDLDPDRGNPIALISAGVGVTPMVSIVNSLVAAGSQRPISWIHGVRDTQVQAFGEHIQTAVQQHPNIVATVFRSREAHDAIPNQDSYLNGRIDLTRLDRNKQLFLDDDEAEYYVCGPTGFMKDVQQFLVDAGVSGEKIHAEIFNTGDGA